MRKFILAIFAALLIAGGCSKSEDSLAGTSWQTTGYGIMDIFYGYHYKVLTFTSDSSVDVYWADKNGNIVDADGSANYSYHYPDLSIYEDGEESKYKFINEGAFALIKVDGSLSDEVVYYRRDL